MKARTQTDSPALAGQEPWPAPETRWPSAIWMSPWAFADEDSGAGEDADVRVADEPSRH
ncbi:MAG: hypothetical protein IT534_07550 [Bauldia sp.]|nr:hypothetical protein [Bauldia sp.]